MVRRRGVPLGLIAGSDARIRKLGGVAADAHNPAAACCMLACMTAVEAPDIVILASLAMVVAVSECRVNGRGWPATGRGT